MSLVSQEEVEEFFGKVREASAAAIWCALATVRGDEPRVRMVHPTWEGQHLWFATSPKSPKALQISKNPVVDIQYQVSQPGFVHIMVRGQAELLADDETRLHAWNVLDYDLKDFFPGGPQDSDYVAVRIEPTRVELSEMFGSTNKRVWKA